MDVKCRCFHGRFDHFGTSSADLSTTRHFVSPRSIPQKHKIWRRADLPKLLAHLVTCLPLAQRKSLVKGCSTEQPQDHHVVFVVIGGEHVPIPRIWVLCMLLLLLLMNHYYCTCCMNTKNVGITIAVVTMLSVLLLWSFYINIWQCVKTLYPCSSHQNSWDLWMFIPQKMVLIGIDPYPYYHCHDYYRCCYDHLTVWLEHRPMVELDKETKLGSQRWRTKNTCLTRKMGMKRTICQYVSPGRWGCVQVELMYSHAKTC